MASFYVVAKIYYLRLLHWAFERLYHELAWSYDLVAAVVSRGHWSRWIVAAVPYLGPGPVLELGCGTGYLQLELGRASIGHAGLDASVQMLRQAARRLDRSGLPPRVLRGRAQSLPVAAASFSDVVATFPAPYILDAATLGEVRRVLQPGGRLLIVDGGRLDRRLYQTVVDLVYNPGAEPLDDDRYGAVLRRSGFTVSRRRIRVNASSVDLVVAAAD